MRLNAPISATSFIYVPFPGERYGYHPQRGQPIRTRSRQDHETHDQVPAADAGGRRLCVPGQRQLCTDFVPVIMNTNLALDLQDVYAPYHRICTPCHASCDNYERCSVDGCSRSRRAIRSCLLAAVRPSVHYNDSSSTRGWNQLVCFDRSPCCCVLSLRSGIAGNRGIRRVIIAC